MPIHGPVVGGARCLHTERMGSSDRDTAETLLSNGLANLGQAAGAGLRTGLLAFARELQRWNRVYNLTAITALDEMVPWHLLDSLAVRPHLPDGRILDVGTGAGLPGVPLALACPERAFVLLDARQKKLRFVRHACRTLGVANVQTVHRRLEDYRPEPAFDAVIARALAPWDELAPRAGHLLKPGGCLLVMAGRATGRPPDGATRGFDSGRRVGLKVPGLAAERHLIILRRDT